MRIIQILPTLSFGDGVSNDAIAIDSTLKASGHATCIYAENIDSRLPEGLAKNVSEIEALNNKVIVIFHLSTGSKLNYILGNYNCSKIIRYHNVTPSQFFHRYSLKLEKLCMEGRQGVNYLADKVDYCLADSEFNKQDLIRAGFKCKVDVLPILVPFKDYAKRPNKKILNKFNDDWINIIFTGRIAPNKKQEDIIKSFYYYKKYVNSKSRLILVGSYDGMELYYNNLKRYVEELDLKDVIFSGHIKFDEILAFYRIADVFVCMSEHEGFCIPLLEAMYFNIPIIAYKNTGVSDTMSNCGILLDAKSPILVAELINKIVVDKDLQEQIINGQKERLKHFQYEQIQKIFLEYLQNFIGDSV